MINVIGQLTDQLREIYDLISSLLSKVRNFVTFAPGDHKKLPGYIRRLLEGGDFVKSN
jgi:hypothetical protein